MAFDSNQHSYTALRNIISERTNGFVAWIGSGLSAPAGLPTWGVLKSKLVNALKDKALTFAKEDAQSLLGIADKIEKEQNYWVSFQRLQKDLGPTTYREIIREALSPASSTTIPNSYNLIWKLHPRGIINLNLDRFATRAFSEVVSGKVNEFPGNKAGELTYLLKDPCSFIANLHGTSDDYSSWVFTKKELDELYRNPGYVNFVRTCLSWNTIVFIGISVDDFAVGGHLKRLSALGIQTGPHYWITDRCDREIDSSAEKIGIRIIRYFNEDGRHHELTELLNDIANYIPREEKTFQPVVFSPVSNEKIQDLPSAEAISNLEAEEIRLLLNSYANRLLQPQEPESLQKFSDFCKKYDQAIYRAWYTSTLDGQNKLLGYSLNEVVGRGAFGKVYKAEDKEGLEVAVKILLEEIRNNHDLLLCFRRGVKSMQILSQHEIKGMVKYLAASEIPAFVVMDWIDGPDLKQAIESKLIQGWETILKIAIDLTTVIRDAHALPERVLHRDIRPTNVMLDKFFIDSDSWKVVVLDFDLSWHRDAIERSVIHGSSGLGYLAPEQLRTISNISTRHAAVDSFGLGMTFYFMASGTDPLPGQHLHAEWKDNLLKKVRGKKCKLWASLPTRFARIIYNSTLEQQAKRWDVTQILNELTRLNEALANPLGVESMELLVEEVIARTSYSEIYAWIDDIGGAKVVLPTGVTISIASNESDQKMHLTILWQQEPHHDRKRVSKWLPSAIQGVCDVLRSSGWAIEYHDFFISQEVKAIASITRNKFAEDIDKTAQSINKAAEKLSFD